MLDGIGAKIVSEIMMQFEGEPATPSLLKTMSEALSRVFFERIGVAASFHIDVDEDGTAAITPKDATAVLLVSGKESDAIFSDKFSKEIEGATWIDHPDLPHIVVIFDDGVKPKVRRIER